MKNIKTLAAIPLAAVVILGGGAAAGYASLVGAQAVDTKQIKMDHKPGVHGTIASISGSTLTITGKDGATYTVDATNATVKTAAEGSAPTTGAFSDLAVGDQVGVRGTVSGTSVVATEIIEGTGFKSGEFSGEFKGMGRGGHGRGQGVIGTVSAVNGSTITLTGKDGTSYTVDAGSATVQKRVTGSLGDVTVGDTIGVQGTVSGTSVTATTIMDDMPTPSAAQ
jgi:hypothetical protein